MKQFLLLALLFISFSSGLKAQEITCEVSLDVIKGKYTGECDNGKANGKGKSIGIDEYEGEFVSGYPEGKGMYTWSDGHYFIGFFKKGKKEGKGDMYYESSAGEDSVITGFWKKDKYWGPYEKQYIVMGTTTRINKVECTLMDKKGEDIVITVHQLSSGTTLNYSVPLATISSITNLSGTFYTKNSQILTNNTITKLQQVTYPFRAIFYFSNGENADILFNENGNYSVYVDML